MDIKKKDLSLGQAIAIILLIHALMWCAMQLQTPSPPCPDGPPGEECRAEKKRAADTATIAAIVGAM